MFMFWMTSNFRQLCDTSEHEQGFQGAMLSERDIRVESISDHARPCRV